MFSQGIAEGINIHAKGIDTVFDDIDSFFDFMRCILSISDKKLRILQAWLFYCLVSIALWNIWEIWHKKAF